MSGNDKNIKLVKDFIFNDRVQNILSHINDNLMEFNILEITGMGNQEIKHSNILGWLFDDSEHNLEYYILDNFLKKVIEENRKNDVTNTILDNLQSYIYLADKKKDIIIYREKDNIDLLIVDEANKIVITIENKVDASERTEGKDGGQLSKYETIINTKYKSKNEDTKNTYNKYFIFLTKDLEEPTKGEEYWMKASHQMVTDVIEEILNTKKDIVTKTKIIFESYVDLLKRNGIVADTDLEKLCEKIWSDEKYKNAFEIIINYRPNKLPKLIEILEKAKIEKKYLKPKSTNGSYSFFIKFNQESPLTYIIQYSTKLRKIWFSIVTNDTNVLKTNSTLEINKKKFTLNNKTKRHEYTITTKYEEICTENDLINDEGEIVTWLDKAKERDMDIVEEFNIGEVYPS